MDPSDNTPNYSITELVNEHCATGENPYYHPDTDCVYWTDIPNGKIFAYDPTTRTHTLIYDDPQAQAGGFTLQENGDWLLFRETDLALMDPDGQVSTLLPFSDEGARRSPIHI